MVGSGGNRSIILATGAWYNKDCRVLLLRVWQQKFVIPGLAGSKLGVCNPNYGTSSTVKTRIIGPCARTLDLPLILVVRSVFFSFSFVSGGVILVCSPPLPEEEISDYIAHGPIIRVLR